MVKKKSLKCKLGFHKEIRIDWRCSAGWGRVVTAFGYNVYKCLVCGKERTEIWEVL